MNSKKFLKIFLLLVVLLFAVARAQEEEDETKDVEVADESAETKEVAKEEEPAEEEQEEPEQEEVEEVKEEPKEEVKEEVKEESKSAPAPAPAPVQQDSKPASKPAPVQTQTQASKPVVQKVEAAKPVQQQQQTHSQQQAQPQAQSQAQTQEVKKQATQEVTQKSQAETKNASSNPNAAVKNTSANAATNNSSNANAGVNANTNAAAANTAAAAGNAVVPAANAAAAANTQATNAVVPQVNNNAASTGTTSNTSNVSIDTNNETKEGGNGAVTTTVISLVAVGAVVGVATVGVNAYKKKTANDDTSREVELNNIEVQPMNTDFGNNMAPEDYNPYNIMNDGAAEPYVTNNPYEYKPNYDNYDEVMDTTPFQKNETAQDNFMSRESIFSNAGNIPQIGNDVFNFGDNTPLPYVQDLPAESGYVDEPVSNDIQVENYQMPNSQMPTLVPAQPEIVVTQTEDEPVDEGYKQIVPNVAQMEIIETPDFNNMTTSMIEDHINNMDLENLANTETKTQSQEEDDGGYKQIVPDIQEATIETFDVDDEDEEEETAGQEDDNGYKQIVPDIQEATIENFDIDDDDDDQDMSVVDNITDTYRAALRATYCSTTDDARFSYRTVDSDHSLLHNMREDGEW